MQLRPVLIVSALLLASVAVANDAPAMADALPPECATFSWDVSGELAALQSPAVASVAGRGGADVVRIETGRRYDVRLHPQREVTLAAPPGKPMLEDAATAGLLTFTVPANGRYLVSITTGHWVDVVDVGAVVASLDFQGRRGCPLVHKIVKFELEAGRDLVLQFAGGSPDEAGVVITPAAASTP